MMRMKAHTFPFNTKDFSRFSFLVILLLFFYSAETFGFSVDFCRHSCTLSPRSNLIREKRFSFSKGAATLDEIIESESDSLDELPFTEVEDYVLKDSYPRYVVGSGKYVLWQRMGSELPELIGRRPQALRKRWLQLNQRSGEVASERHLQPPILEDWTWGENGEGDSLVGRVYLYPGLAEGSTVTTAPVGYNGKHIEDQYIQTEGGVVFQLGTPKEAESIFKLKSPFNTKTDAIIASAALAGATATIVSILSHHLNISIFVV